MRFAIYTGTKYKEIPQDFDSIEEVRKLRVLKNHPDWPVVPWPISLDEQRIIAANYAVQKATHNKKPVAVAFDTGASAAKVATKAVKKLNSKLLPTPTIAARRKELRQIENSLPAMRELRDKLRNLERSARSLMHKDSTCGLHLPATDYWVSLSIAYDNICAAINRANLRKGQLVSSYKHNSVVE